MRANDASNVGSASPRKSRISAQRVEDVIKTSKEPALRKRAESFSGRSTSNALFACLTSETLTPELQNFFTNRSINVVLPLPDVPETPITRIVGTSLCDPLTAASPINGNPTGEICQRPHDARLAPYVNSKISKFGPMQQHLAEDKIAHRRFLRGLNGALPTNRLLQTTRFISLAFIGRKQVRITIHRERKWRELPWQRMEERRVSRKGKACAAGVVSIGKKGGAPVGRLEAPARGLEQLPSLEEQNGAQRDGVDFGFGRAATLDFFVHQFTS
jgi:hypothetical protein